MDKHKSTNQTKFATILKFCIDKGTHFSSIAYLSEKYVLA